ncbi:MAG: pseudaminic acid synthase, partial [Deltaproteobacteria bacterium]
RSVFAVSDIRKGEKFTKENIRRIRPGDGLAPKYYATIMGKTASQDIQRGTPITWELI